MVIDKKSFIDKKSSLLQSELEEQYQKLQVDNVRVEAELKHEKQKVEMLQRDLLDSQKVSDSGSPSIV